MIKTIVVAVAVAVAALFVPRRQPPPDAVDYAEQEERLMPAAATAARKAGRG